MKTFKLKSLSQLSVASILLISASVLASGSSNAIKPSVANGAKVYNQNCGRCHNPVPADQYSANAWGVIMPHMRAKAHLTRQESEDVKAFLQGVVGLSQAVGSAEQKNTVISVKRGEDLVSQFGCQGCHTVKGEGGSMGPNLDQVYNRKGAAFIFNKLQNPSFNNPATTMPNSSLSDVDIKSLVQYLESIAQ